MPHNLIIIIIIQEFKIRSCSLNYELLFRHIPETQINIQTQIQKNFILALGTNDFYLEVLLRLPLCRRNAPNNRQNDKFLETCFFANNLVVDNSLQYFNKN